MVIKTTKGFFKLLTNIKDAWNKEEFERKYLDDYFTEDNYILGDISSSMLRLKGFKDGNNKQSALQVIDKYIVNDCAFHCPYYIVQRIDEAEYLETYKEENNKLPYGSDLDIDKVYESEKHPFDYDSLVLESSPAVKPHIVLEMQKINKVVTFGLPEDLKNLSTHSSKKTNTSKRHDSSSIKSNEAKKESSKKAADKNSEKGIPGNKPKKTRPRKKKKNTSNNPNSQNNQASQIQSKPNEAAVNGTEKVNNKPKRPKRSHKKPGQNNPNNQNPNTTAAKSNKPNVNNKKKPVNNNKKIKNTNVKVENNGGI